MCDQTEIEYLEGDVVWVKLGSTWWPGEVVSFNNCPEAVQFEAQKKSLIAVVKFFQEENFEYVKNYHQIYKYNCLQKDEFIKKGMDKYRAKEKEKSSLMKNFPGDVVIAEKMTNGNPEILSERKFLPEEKPDISSLFGEPKKPTKKKREDGRKSIGSGDKLRKIHRTKSFKPKFKRNVDNLPLLPLSPVNSYYPCYKCDFITTKVNNICYHLRSHKTENGMVTPVKSRSPLKGKQNSQSTSKRKYVRKDKSLTKKSKVETSTDGEKRKQAEEEDQVLKKSKIDSTLNDIMADWDVSNDGMDQSVDVSDNETENTTMEENKDKDKSENDTVLDETDKLLKETEKLISPVKSVSKYSLKSPTIDEKKGDKYTLKDKLGLTGKTEEKQSEEDKKSRLACFDFSEEDSEPTIPHVRKIPRASGMPLKKEIIKEFEKSQALKNEKEKKDAIKDSVQDKGKLDFRARKENDVEKSINEKESDLSLPKNDDMSVDFTETSSISSMELLKKIDSFIDQCASPTKSDSSSFKIDTSPLKRESSPLKRDSPMKKTLSPCKKDFFPEELKSPSRGNASPNRKESPFRADKSPSPVKKKLNLDYSPKASSPFRAEKSSSPLKSSTQIEENVEILEIVEFEAEVENVNFRKDTESKTQPVTEFHGDDHKTQPFLDQSLLDQDKKDLDNNKDTSFYLDESILSEANEVKEKPVDEPVVKKKGRGRPRKNPILSEPANQTETPIKPSLNQSESDSDRSQFSGRRRKPNRRYVNMDSDSYLSSPDRISMRTDDSQSDTEEQPVKPVEEKKKVTGKRGRPPKSYYLQRDAEQREREAKEKLQFENKMDNFVAQIKTDDDKLLEEDKAQNHLEEKATQESTMEILPPKKSQIKKFEQAQLDLENKMENKTENKTENKMDQQVEQTQVLFMEVVQEEVVKSAKENVEESKEKPKSVQEKTEEQKSPSKSRHKANYLPTYPYKPKREFIEENVANTFQEAFVKTIQIDTSTLKTPTKEPPILNEKECTLQVPLKDPETIQPEKAIINSEPKSEKLDESVPAPGSASPLEVCVPVKKREKPRIIENVTLKQPIILKSHLLENKSLKHKIEVESPRNTSSLMAGGVAGKVQKINEDQIPQSSLEEMELDITNMPFVYSEDILTPESIEKMPVMISSMPIQTTSTSVTPLKKKSGVPAILKSKAKGKPMIRSIKSIVPPLEGIMPKTTIVMDKSNNAVKYVQTLNNQPVRYAMQPKLTHAQKLPIQSDKTTRDQQQDCKVVQHGSKVYIFSHQGQAKTFVGMNKTTKVQRIVSNRSQTYTTLSPQGTPIKSVAVKSEAMPTTSKMVPLQKLVLPGKSSVLGNVIQSGVKGNTILASGSNVNLVGKPVIGTRPKTILTTQARSSILGKMPTSKGTVLTPITGQEVKALRAGQKVQSPQQIPLLQRVKKIPQSEQISLAAGMSTGTTIVYKSPAGNAVKKPVTKQIVMQSINSQQKLMTKMSSPKIVVTKGKQVLSGVPKIVQNKTIISTEINESTPVITKTMTPKSEIISTLKSVSKSPGKGVQQKNLLSVAWSSALGDVEEQSTSEIVVTTAEEKTEEQVVVAEEPKTEAAQPEDKAEEMKMVPGQFYAVPSENPDGTVMYYMYVADEHGNLTAIDNNDAVVLGESGALNNLVIQTPDNGDVSTIQTTETETSQSSEVGPAGNQDILAAALANTDFQQDLIETPAVTLSSTDLINQTIMQPTSEPISLTSVLETSLTINQPIMTPLEVPSNMPTQSETMSNVPSVTKIPPTSLELPITITDPNISYIAAGESQLLTSNSMPEIADIIDTNVALVESNQTETTPTTQYIVIPDLEDNVGIEQTQSEEEIPAASFSVSIPENITIDEQVQSTPSMPIIDDSFTESFTETVETTTAAASFPDPETPIIDDPTSKEVTKKVGTTIELQATEEETQQVQTQGCVETEKSADTVDAVVVEETIESSASEDTLNQPLLREKVKLLEKQAQEVDPQVKQEEHVGQVIGKVEEQVEKQDVEQCEDVQMKENDVTSESKVEEQLADRVTYELMDTSEPLAEETPVVETSESTRKEAIEEQATVSPSHNDDVKEQPLEPIVVAVEQPEEAMDVDEVDRVDTCAPADGLSHEAECAKAVLDSEPLENFDEAECATAAATAAAATAAAAAAAAAVVAAAEEGEPEMNFDEAETSQEAPSQSYDRDEVEIPSQSAKSENSREPTQSFDDADADVPTQSFHEILENRIANAAEAVDDPSFPTQSYEVDKPENISETLDTDQELSQEGNLPSQSNDDGIGTSSLTNSLGFNEDETASSSYVPETPETQERDQDQESAISTSSYEIAPCEELNIASSSVIPDTSVHSEHMSIHDNGVPEIPTSSYNLNPDSSSTHRDAVPTSSYEDQVIVEHNVSTSYDVPISMPGLEDASSQNFVTESSDQRNEPSSYYLHHQEVSASYYNPSSQGSNSRLKSADAQEEVSASYYESAVRNEASQSYFVGEEATQSYCGQNLSSGYYDPQTDAEASQSFYSGAGHSSMQNVEASQSFYQEPSATEQRDGEATPASYPESYQMDYAAADSPIDRHDLVESSSARQR